MTEFKQNIQGNSGFRIVRKHLTRECFMIAIKDLCQYALHFVKKIPARITKSL